jgi:hypothetical protein
MVWFDDNTTQACSDAVVLKSNELARKNLLQKLGESNWRDEIPGRPRSTARTWWEGVTCTWETMYAKHELRTPAAEYGVHSSQCRHSGSGPGQTLRGCLVSRTRPSQTPRMQRSSVWLPAPASELAPPRANQPPQPGSGGTVESTFSVEPGWLGAVVSLLMMILVYN